MMETSSKTAMKALQVIGIGDEERDDLLTIVAAILHIGTRDADECGCSSGRTGGRHNKIFKAVVNYHIR